MRSSRLFVRSRGQVRGPFDVAELRALRDRGQLRRFHEVSEDGDHWLSASCLTDLFPGETAVAAEAEAQTIASASPAPAWSLPATSITNPQAEWFYATADDRQQGPITEGELETLWTEGVVTDRALVWRPGMSRWQPYAACRPREPRRGDHDGGSWERTWTGLSLVLAGSFATPAGWGLILLATLMLSTGWQNGQGGVLLIGWLVEALALGLCLIGHALCLTVPQTAPGLRRLAQVVFGLALVGAVLSLAAAVLRLAGHFDSAYVALVGGRLGLLALSVNTLTFLVFLFFLRSIARVRGLGSTANALMTLLVSWACYIGAVVLFSVVLLVTVGLTGDDNSVDGRIRELRAAGVAFVLFVVVSLLLLLALYGWYLYLLRRVCDNLDK